MHITVVAITAPEPRRSHLRCPICDVPHIEPVTLACSSLLGQSGAMQVDDRGLHLDPTTPSAEDRAVIDLTFRCRQGHQFVLRLRSTSEGTIAESFALPCSRTALDAERN